MNSGTKQARLEAAVERPTAGKHVVRSVGFLMGAVIAIWPLAANSSYLIYIASFAALYAVAAIGLNIVWGYSGQVAFAPAALVGVGAYTHVILAMKLSVHPWTSALIAVLVAGLFGLIVGLPSLRLGHFYLAMVTFGLAELMYAVFLNARGLTGGAGGIFGIPPLRMFGGTLGYGGVYVLSLVVLGGAVLSSVYLAKSWLGLAFRAIRDYPDAAVASGVRLGRVKMIAFGISGLYFGIAGVLYVYVTGFVSPEAFGFSGTVKILTMMLVGGAGSLAGPIVGAVAIVGLEEWLRAFDAFRSLLLGVLIWVTVTVFPKGLVGLAGLAARWYRRRKARG